MLIKNMEINNFKSIEHLNVDLGNLTILAGANSVGKSSFIQSILLLKQNQKVLTQDIKWQQLTQIDVFSINGELIQLGNVNNLLFTDAQTDCIEIKIDCDYTSYAIEYNGDKWSGFKSKKDLQSKNYKSFIQQHIFDISEINSQYQSDLFEYLNVNLFKHAQLDLFSDNKFTYLHTNRLPPKMTYEMSDNNIEQGFIGYHGEYTAHYLAKNKNKELVIKALKHPNSQTNYLLENVSYWLGEISSNIDITAEANENTMQASIAYSYIYGDKKTKELTPLNVGFGISYVLPIIAVLLSSKPNDLIIIENPETHLHPKAQANIAKLFALAANSGVQIIIETHSDHILNGVRVATKNKVIKTEDLKVYFFNKDESSLAMQVEEIKIGKDGSVSSWPVGFFDEWDNQLGKLLW